MQELAFPLLLWNVIVAAAMAMAIAIVCRVSFVKRRPALRHSLWLLVLVKLVTPPLIPLPVLGEGLGTPALAGQPSAEPQIAATAKPQVQPDWDLAEDSADSITTETIPIAPAPVQPMNSQSIDTAPTRQSSSAALGMWALCSISGTWIVVAALLLCRSWLRVRRLSRLIQLAEGGNDRIRKIVQNAATRMRVGNVIVRMVDSHVPPMIWLARSGPVIVFPKGLVAQLSDQQIMCVACHELAHYVRRDQWFNTFALLVTSVCWWHPAAWIARREMMKAQELCCDERVLECCPVSRRSYLETLLQAFDFVSGEPVASTAPASTFFDSQSVRSRFETLSCGKQIAYNSRWIKAAILFLFVTLLCWPVNAQKDDVDESDSADPLASIKDAAEEGVGTPLSDTDALFLHWYKPGYGDHEPPEPILTMKVVPSKEFDVFFSDRSANGRQSSIAGRIGTSGSDYVGKIDAKWKTAEQFSGTFELEVPVDASAFTWSRGCAPTSVVLSRHSSSQLFIEKALEAFNGVRTRINVPDFLTDPSENSLGTAAVRLSTYAPEFGFSGSASLANAIHSNTNRIYDHAVSDEVAGRNLALCRDAIEKMFSQAELKTRWNLNVEGNEEDLIDLRQSETLRFALDLGEGRKWDELTEVKLFLKGSPQKNNFDYRDTMPPAKSFLWF